MAVMDSGSALGGGGRHAIRSWLPNIGFDARASAERSLILAAAFVRLTAVIQSALSLPMIMKAADTPLATLLIALAFIAESTLVTVAAAIRGTVPPGRQALLDAGFGLFILVHPAIWWTSGHVGSWSQWQFAAGMSVACYVALSVNRPIQIAILSVSSAVAYLIGTLAPPTESEVQSAFVNTVAFLCLVPAVFIVATYLRSLARHLNRARELNARLATDAAIAEERAAQRIVLHDTAGFLAMLGENADPDLDRILRAQAQSMSRELRRRVYTTNDQSRERTLHEIVAATTAAYGDLPLAINTLLANERPLTTDAQATTASALRTLLDNIRQHANAGAVTIHATASDHEWALVVRDDGVGFDATAPMGFGLTEQVVGQCQLLGIEVTIDSEPGEGAVIELRGSGSTFASPPATDVVDN